jgi:hypothetical protein
MVFMGIVFFFFGCQEVMPLAPRAAAAGDGIAPARRGHTSQFILSGMKTQPFFGRTGITSISPQKPT